MFSFTATEKRELFIGCIIFLLVELSSIIFLFNTLFDLLVLSVLIIPLFLFHELAHKFVAQGFGLRSEFRLYPNMALLSLISIIPLFPVKIIAPGVVFSSGRGESDISARISLAGPMLNILLSGIFLISAAFVNTYWASFLLLASRFSFDLAVFNLLPFSVLDGAKVIQWNERLFLLIFIAALVLWAFHPFGILGGLFI
ncbi:MAG: hypothetical protein ACXAC8_00590 [Candidatus Hodarchaeales archaeon]|jgi:Zn-dependent protease